MAAKKRFNVCVCVVHKFVLLCFFVMESTPYQGTFKHFLKEITIQQEQFLVGLGRITEKGQESYLAILPRIPPYQTVEIEGLRANTIRFS